MHHPRVKQKAWCSICLVGCLGFVPGTKLTHSASLGKAQHTVKQPLPECKRKYLDSVPFLKFNFRYISEGIHVELSTSVPALSSCILDVLQAKGIVPVPIGQAAGKKRQHANNSSQPPLKRVKPTGSGVKTEIVSVNREPPPGEDIATLQVYFVLPLQLNLYFTPNRINWRICKSSSKS
jgi:hypothetical protein